MYETKLMSGDTVSSYSENEMYYNKADFCPKGGDGSYGSGDLGKQCISNKEKYDRFIILSNQESQTAQRLNDIRSYTNREIQYTVNLGLGVGLLSYYIYVEKLYKALTG